MIESFNIIGILAFALSGYLSATRKGADLLGVFIISFVTAFAGGLIRDISINKIPSLYYDNLSFYLVLFVMFFAYLFKLHEKNIEDSFYFKFADSIGLVAFSISGALAAISLDMSIFGVLLLSLITATGGGILRDLLLRKKVFLLHEDIYGVLSLFIGFFVYVFNGNYLFIIFFLFILIRFIIIKKKMNLIRLS